MQSERTAYENQSTQDRTKSQDKKKSQLDSFFGERFSEADAPAAADESRLTTPLEEARLHSPPFG